MHCSLFTKRLPSFFGYLDIIKNLEMPGQENTSSFLYCVNGEKMKTRCWRNFGFLIEIRQRIANTHCVTSSNVTHRSPVPSRKRNRLKGSRIVNLFRKIQILKVASLGRFHRRAVDMIHIFTRVYLGVCNISKTR